jgi:RNA polymerase-binding transcription factor DksA
MNSALAIRCRACGHTERFTIDQLANRLRELGCLRRQAEPSPELALELAQSALADARFGKCAQCGAGALGTTTEQDEADDAALWGDARHCERCKQVIPPERLEIFPGTRLCPACQRKDEAGASDEREFCPRCGDVLQLRAVRKPGAAYQMVCPSCKAAR